MESRINDINAELKQLKIKEKYLEVINSFAATLIEAQSIDEIVWTVAKHTIAKLNYYDFVIYLYDADKDKLVQKAAYGPKNPKSKQIKSPIEISPGVGIVGKVFASGIGEIVADTSLDERYLVDDEARLSEITVPLSYKGKMVGVLDSEHPERNFFNEQDFKMLTTIAAMVSTKIEQARANDELMKYKENLELLIDQKTEELNKTNEILTKQNKEKELLLNEIHHRVKNNMQIMISLINLQAANSDIEHEQMVLREFRDRIRSMSLIHERLYMERDISTIAISEYISELSNSLLSSFHDSQEVEIIRNVQEMHLDLDTAIPLGLIINELITNSLKHAFKNIAAAQIIISFQIENGIGLFEYRDNGPGFELDSNKGSTFGLDLIDILVNQIGSDLKYENKAGSRFNFAVKMK